MEITNIEAEAIVSLINDYLKTAQVKVCENKKLFEETEDPEVAVKAYTFMTYLKYDMSKFRKLKRKLEKVVGKVKRNVKY